MRVSKKRRQALEKKNAGHENQIQGQRSVIQSVPKGSNSEIASKEFTKKAAKESIIKLFDTDEAMKKLSLEEAEDLFKELSNGMKLLAQELKRSATVSEAALTVAEKQVSGLQENFSESEESLSERDF